MKKTFEEATGKLLEQSKATTDAFWGINMKFLLTVPPEEKPPAITNVDPNICTTVRSITKGKKDIWLK